MSDEYDPYHDEILEIDPRDYEECYLLTSECVDRWIHEAKDIVVYTIKAKDAKELHNLGPMLSHDIEVELEKETPNLQVYKILSAALRSYHSVIRSSTGFNDNSLKSKLVARFEQDLSTLIDAKDLFIFTVVQEIELIDLYESLPLDVDVKSGNRRSVHHAPVEKRDAE